MRNNVKRKLDEGTQALGTFIWSGSDAVVECMGYTGLDFVLIDSEHSAVDTEKTVNLIRIAKLKGLAPFVRVKDFSRSSILKMLDCGAEALVIPCLKTEEEVRQIVNHGKYFPLGQRGFAPNRQAGYGFEEYAKDMNEYFEMSNSETLLLPMCETAEFLSDLENIVKIDGVDGIFVGPYDLSIALGAPGVFDSREFEEALRYVAEVCRAAGKYSFIFSASPDVSRKHLAMGYQGSVLSTDVITIINAFKEQVEYIRK